ncbi:MAG: AAA family ATPase [Acidobacteriota bacterium]
MSYYQALGLSREPFSNSPDPDMLYRSRTHLECLQHMEIAVRLRRGLNVVLGEVGTGKTTLSRELIRLLTQDGDIEVHLLEDPQSPSATEFLLTLTRLFGLDVAAADGNAALLKDAIKDWLLTRGQEGGRIVALLIDEGQKITPECLELLRELLNFETNTHKLLQIVIFAQSEFDAVLLARPNLDDRVNFRYRLLPLNPLETRRMIETRLALCAPEGSAPAAVFTQLALRRIYRLTRGYPRKIVRLCHLSMLLAVGFGKRRIGWRLVGQASREVTGSGRLWLRRLILAGAGAGLASLCLYFAGPALPGVRLATLDALGRLQTSLRAGAPEAGALPASQADALTAAPAAVVQAPRDLPAVSPAAPTLAQDTAAPAETALTPAKILAAKDTVGRVVAAAAPVSSDRPDQAVEAALPAGSALPAPDQAMTSAGRASDQGLGSALALAAAALPPESAVQGPTRGLAKADAGHDVAGAAVVAPETAPTPATASLPATLGASRVPVGWVVTRQAARIYGSGNRSVMARIAKANPGLDCNLVRAGDAITFPAIPADPLPQGSNLIRVASTDSLEKGFAIITRHREVEPVLSLYCTHQPGLGLRFDVVLAREYASRQEAEAALAGLPRDLAEGAVVVDRFPAGTVTFTDLGLWQGRRPAPKTTAPASRQVAVTEPVLSTLP